MSGVGFQKRSLAPDRGTRSQSLPRMACRPDHVRPVILSVYSRRTLDVMSETGCVASGSCPLPGERVDRDGAFTGQRGPGLRPPTRRQKAALGRRAKGYGRSGRTARYGPQAGEGSVARRGRPKTARFLRRHENDCAEGTLECGSGAAALNSKRYGGSSAAALQGASRIFMQSSKPKHHGICAHNDRFLSDF